MILSRKMASGQAGSWKAVPHIRAATRRLPRRIVKNQFFVVRCWISGLLSMVIGLGSFLIRSV
jgi:hypothetical protein